MLGASWVDEHSIAALAAEHNQLLHALLLAADRSRVGLLCGIQALALRLESRRAKPEPTTTSVNSPSSPE